MGVRSSVSADPADWATIVARAPRRQSLASPAPTTVSATRQISAWHVPLANIAPLEVLLPLSVLQGSTLPRGPQHAVIAMWARIVRMRPQPM
jgi:hypothetical protein